ncbi:MAG: SDR family oxidoreductase [Spirochaetales bacterium]|nr:SDR family oxidoreductase [Spirochaetales bacterium]
MIVKNEKSTITYDYTGTYALVTGATKGIGRDIALSFAKAGSTVGVTGRNNKELISLVKEISDFGGCSVPYAADLSNAESCLEMAEFFSGTFPSIDILVNNAGLSFPELLVDIDWHHWDTTMQVNLRAPALIAKVLAPGMIKHRKGVIINISSNACLAGIAEHTAYCASKFGLEGLTKVMAVELGPHNIRVNSIAPTIVLTPMGEQVWGDAEKADPIKEKIPLGRFVYPHEVTSVVLFLASEGASMIHGETIIIDGGVHAKLY